MLKSALKFFFEEQVQFQLRDGTEIEGSVFIGSTELFPVEVLRDDAEAYREEFDLWLSEKWKPSQQQRRAEILALPGNKKRYADLLDAVRREQVVPFVGSGMSVASGLPTWSDLLRNVREFTSCDKEELQALIQAFKFEEAADLLASSTNPRLLAERVEHDLRIDDPSVISGAVRILPALFPKLVITTNLDDVLENLYLLCEQPFGHVLAGSALAQYRSLNSPNIRILLKLHGDCRQISGRVLLSKEYESTYSANGTVREELKLLYQFNHLLFIGCSLGFDRTVRLIEEVSKADASMPKHYCFISLPDDTAIRIERENFLTQRGIYPIWYDLPHDESLIALLDGLLVASEGH
jgi:hypothetical protein